MHMHLRKKGREGGEGRKGRTSYRELVMLVRIRDRNTLCRAARHNQERKATFRQNYQKRLEQIGAARSMEPGRRATLGGVS